jgi:phospholipid/cholesterol/gamma-HCH transport system substrate-binding protein
MDERILKFRVGILVVISMLILGILILTISGKPFFGTSYQLSGTTKNASGISSGTPIKKFGLPIGRVTKVAPSPNGKEVTVWMSIQETDSNGLKQTIDTSTEMAVIGSESILGDVVINIEPAKKNENKSQIESEIIITKSNPIEAVLGEQGSNLMSELESLLKPNPDVKTNFGDTVAEIKSAAGAITNMFETPSSDDEPHNLPSAIASFQKTSDLINAMFEKREDQKNIYYTLDSLYNTSEAFRAMFQKSNPDDDLNFAMALERIVKTSDSINATSDIAGNTFRRYGEIPKKWEGEVRDKVIELIGNTSRTVKSLEAKPNSLLEKALTDEKIGTDLDTLSGSLAKIAIRAESLAEKVNEDEILRITAKLNLLLDDLRFFGDSLARNPGSIVRGALRPRNDIGPKSSPTVIWEEDGYFQE